MRASSTISERVMPAFCQVPQNLLQQALRQFVCLITDELRLLYLFLFGLLFSGIVLSGSDAQAQMVSFEFRGTRQYGKTIAYDAQTLILLSRDGRSYQFPIAELHNLTELTSEFTSLSQAEMRGVLQAEHGSEYEVSGTGKYLTVHPRGSDNWGQRFERIYRAIHHFVSVRGFDPQPLEFPLVAIVLEDRARFEQYSRRLNVSLADGVVGYYHPLSNRIVVYDQVAQADGRTWKDNSETIIHEAAHQVAHNIGLHARLADTPVWVIEGFGTMFEAEGVWNSLEFRQQTSRINAERLDWFQQQFVDKKVTNWLPQMVNSDQLFQTEPLDAYASAWMLTFYLSEHRSADYYAYLQHLRKLKPAQRYSAAHRLQDFERFFGDDWQMLEAHVMQFASHL
jgi:hypothetical protein